MQPLAQDQAIALAKSALPLADLNGIIEKANAATLANDEAQDIFDEHNASIEEATQEVHSDLHKLHKDTITVIQESMATAHLTANKVIHDIYQANGITSNTDVASIELSLEDLTRINRSELLIRNLETVNKQTGLIAFVNEANINSIVAYNPVFAEREFKKLKHYLRTNKITGFDVSNAITLAKKYGDSYEAVRDKLATLYCFLRYLNHLKATKQLVPNMVYMHYTAALICASFTGQMRLGLTDAIKPLIKQHVISK